MDKRSLSAYSRIWILALCLFLIGWSAGLQAQTAPASQFLFPYFVSLADESSGIAIFNPNAHPAVVTLTLSGFNGALIAGAGVVNPATLTVPARGQIAKTAGELFGTGIDLNGSLEISSSAAGLVAYYQSFDPGLTFLDGNDATEAAMNLVFPVVPGNTEGIAEIDFVNPNLHDTSVELKLWNFEGNLLGTVTIQVKGGGFYRNLAQVIFPPGTSFSRASHITATSKPRNVLTAAQSVAGTSRFAGFSSTASSGGALDLAAMNAVPLTAAANSGVIPYFHTGGQYASTLAVVNLETASANITVTAMGNNGSALGTHVFNVQAQGGLRAPLQSLIPELGANEQEGWLLISSSGRTVGGIIYGRSDAASLTALPLLKTPKAEFVFPQIVQGGGLHTDISLVNPNPVTSTVNFDVIAGDGTTLAATQIAIGPSKRVALPLNQIMPEIDTLGGGVLHITATGGLFATASLWSDSGSIVSNFTPQDTEFVANLPASFAVTGKVLVNNRASEGFHVVLSGPVGKIAISDENGNYVFAGVPPGKYTMAVDQFGFQFVPAEASFEITTASKRQDFQGFTAANTILVLPSSLAVGSPNTEVTIFGQDFNPTSEAFADTTRLQTTYVDSSQLQAVVPGFLMAAATSFDITVVTNGSDAGGRVSQAYPFVAYEDKPVLKAVISSGIIAEGSSGGDLTIQGTGFLGGAIVKINGLSDGIQVSVTSDTEILASVPSSYFQQGGIFPVTVENPYPANVESNVQLLAVYFPAPAVESILPKSTPVRLEPGAGPLNIEVLGYGFRRGAVVWFDTTPLFTSYCETDAYCLSVHLYAEVPAELLQKAGFAQIQVKNPDPSIAVSEVTYLRMDGLQPTITSVLPGAATMVNSPSTFKLPVIVDGTNFGPETIPTIYQASAKSPEDVTKEYEVLSSTQLVAWIDVTYPASLDEWFVQVSNPAPGGGTSDTVDFFITGDNMVLNPFLISLSPQTVAAGGSAFTLTINGINLQPGTIVYFNYVALTTTFVTSNQVTAEVPAYLIRSPNRIPICLTNPDTGGTSNRLFLDIR